MLPRTSVLFAILFILIPIIFVLVGPAFGETQKLDSRFDGGVGLACEKEGNINRKVYRSFYKLSKNRKIVATLNYRNDVPTVTALNETTVLPEFIEWEEFRLDRKTLILTNLSISPRRQKCVVVTFEKLLDKAKSHLIELQKGNKI